MNDFVTLKLSPKDMDYVGNLLARQPWGEVNPLICEMQRQFKEQNDARNRPNGPPEPDPASVPG
jgi:hypothetical protein